MRTARAGLLLLVHRSFELSLVGSVLWIYIAESSFTGMGVGAAIKGLRPVVEGINMRVHWCCC